MFHLNYFNMVSEASWSNPWLVNFMELVALVEIMFINVRATARIKIIIIIHFIPCRMFQHAQCIHLKLNFRFIFSKHQTWVVWPIKRWRMKIRFCACGWRINIWNFILILQLLQFGIWVKFLEKKKGVIFCFLLLQNLVFRLSFNFCNLIFLFYLCNYFGISSSLQFLQFGICVQFLQKKKNGVIFCLPLLQNLVFWRSFSFCNLVFLSVSAIVLVFHLLFSFYNLVSASVIWYFCSVFAIVLVFCLLFSFYNLVFELSFCKKKKGVIFCFLLLQNLVFRLSFNFCNLIFLFYLCNYFGISSSLQFLQFGICVQFLQKKKNGVIFCLPLLQNLVFWRSFSFCNLVFLSVSAIVLVFHLLFSFYNLVSASVIWYFCSVFAIVLVFCLLFSFYNLVFELSFCKKKFWSDILSSASTKSGISTFLQLLSWHLLPNRLFGYVGYLLLIWKFSFLILLLWIVTTRVLFRLLTTRFFMSELSTLRSIVILLVIISSMAPLLCLLFILHCRLQISLPKRISYLVFIF